MILRIEPTSYAIPSHPLPLSLSHDDPRQSVRESREGFCPNSDMADVAFDPHTFALDPTRPRLCDMITEEEFDKYSKLRCVQAGRRFRGSLSGPVTRGGHSSADVACDPAPV